MEELSRIYGVETDGTDGTGTSRKEEARNASEQIQNEAGRDAAITTRPVLDVPKGSKCYY